MKSNYITTLRTFLFRALFGKRYEEAIDKIENIAKKKQYDLANSHIYNLYQQRTNIIDYYIFLSRAVPEAKRKIVLANADYFLRNYKYLVVDENSFPSKIDKPFLYTKRGKQVPLEFNSPDFPSYNVDHTDNKYSAWSWHLINTHLSPDQEQRISIYHNRYIRLINKLHNEHKYKRAYLFGTGPSLMNYKKYSFRNGYKIFCNTMVKDPQIWQDLKPDIIVAADALFHYSNTAYARKFREDLAKRLDESKNTYFIYPFIFDTFIRSTCLGAFSDRLIGIPYGKRQEIVTDLTDNFELAELGNALTLMLLPIGASLAKDLQLFGFDGKKPGAKLFWDHSPAHNYPELMPELMDSHPAFMNFHFPTKSSNKYIKDNLAGSLEKMLQKIEKNDWQVHLMHKSHTSVLNKRQQ